MDALLDFEFDQSQRMISVELCDLGVTKVVAISFEGEECLSKMSRFRIEIISRGRAIKPSEILGKKFGVALRVRHQVRRFYGIVCRFEVMHTSIRGHHLHVIDLVPPAWLLTQNKKSKIFPDQSCCDVVKSVLSKGNVAHSPKSVGANREYIVQYNESDFDFISRLLEEVGLFYRFDCSEISCDLIMGNGAADFKVGDPNTLTYGDELEILQPDYRVGPSTFKHASWDFKTVQTIEANTNSLTKTQPPSLGPRSVFEYPGRHEEESEAALFAKVRMEEFESGFICVTGRSKECRLEPGAKFDVNGWELDMPDGGMAETYVIVSVHHSVQDGTLTLFDQTALYHNVFRCMPADLNFRPPRSTPRPLIQGPQTAIVTDTPDEFGRAKVKFPWEETGKSRWVRVGQTWAYNRMGAQFLPRIDSEVIVEFLDGDPDHPIIVGMVFNGKNDLLYSLPGNKTQSGMRGANWGDAGAANTSNEWRFEDKEGSEEIFVHAQKDFRRVVKNDDKLTVEQGNRTLAIKEGDVSETLNLGNHKLKLDAGAAATDAMQSITLTVGGSSIKIDQTGITIKGMMIKIQGDVQVEVDSVMTTVKGDGILTLKGGLTLIN